MTDNILSALDALTVADLDRADWITVGMALKQEGYSCDVWDNWSKNDIRYHAGECDKKWESFSGSETPVTGATIVQMAKDRGWSPRHFEGDGCMDWNDVISYDGISQPSKEWDPAEDLRNYIKALFEPEEYVNYITSNEFVAQNEDGKWVPSGKGVYWRTAKEILADIDKYHNDIAWAIGDWVEEAGAWIRINPLDGEGVADKNVTDFRYALVESDKMSVDEQGAIYNQLELPIAALVNTGNKSLHAIVRVDAKDKAQYRERVNELYKILAQYGFDTDKQNSNPSRLSRMPGVTRNGNRQYLVATNVGRKSWAEWEDFITDVLDDMPDIVSLADYEGNLPMLPDEVIQGVLYKGHKMLISGPSKAGKSFLLMELCVCIAEGLDWLGFKCAKGRVLYINLEIDPNSAIRRFYDIYDAKGIPRTHLKDIETWPLRGKAYPLDVLADKLIRKIRDKHFDVIIFDPIYKIITGDENNATDMGAFCNQFDKVCAATGASAIYCHHHSKGSQGNKRAMDRASGSGVFARDPDALLDLIELELTDGVKNYIRDGYETGWRVETNLREFRPLDPFEIWFKHPLHMRDETGSLKDCKPAGDGNPSQSPEKREQSKTQTKAKHLEILKSAYNMNAWDSSGTTVQAMAKSAGIHERTIRDYLKEWPDVFDHTTEGPNKGKVRRIDL